MASPNVFERKHIDPSQMGKIETLLVHFNLPPPVIDGYRAHRGLIHATLISLIIFVVALSLYNSWHRQRVEKSWSVLATALSQEKDKLSDNLARLMDTYPRTNAALWAEIELAHLAIEKKDYAGAVGAYTTLLDKTGDGNPLRPLLLNALAEAEEAAGQYDQAIAAYEKLQKHQAYQLIACLGLGGQYEAKKDWAKAIAVYEGYKAQVSGRGESEGNDAIAMLDEKIVQLRARQ